MSGLSASIYEKIITERQDKFGDKTAIQRCILEELLDAEPETVYEFSTSYKRYVRKWIEVHASATIQNFLPAMISSS